MTYPAGETITRQRAQTSTDPYSDSSAPDWNKPPAELSIDGWGVDDSRTAEELEPGREAVVTDYALYRDAPADVLPGDRVVVRGHTCEVVGRPATWRSPLTGWEAGFVVRANIVEG